MRVSSLCSERRISSQKSALQHYTSGTLITYLFDIEGSIVPYDFEFRDGWRVFFEIIDSKEISRDRVCQRVINDNEKSYRADSSVNDAAINFPFAFRATDTALGASAGTSNEGFRIVRPALIQIPISQLVHV